MCRDSECRPWAQPAPGPHACPLQSPCPLRAPSLLPAFPSCTHRHWPFISRKAALFLLSLSPLLPPPNLHLRFGTLTFHFSREDLFSSLQILLTLNIHPRSQPCNIFLILSSPVLVEAPFPTNGSSAFSDSIPVPIPRPTDITIRSISLPIPIHPRCSLSTNALFHHLQLYTQTAATETKLINPSTTKSSPLCISPPSTVSSPSRRPSLPRTSIRLTLKAFPRHRGVCIHPNLPLDFSRY